MLSDEQLKEIRERCDNATPGPWSLIEDSVYAPSTSVGPLWNDGDNWFDCDSSFIVRHWNHNSQRKSPLRPCAVQGVPQWLRM